MRAVFTSKFRLYVAGVLTDQLPRALSIVSSSSVSSIFDAMTVPCCVSSLSLTGDICLWESMLHYILENHLLFPLLRDIYYHCSPPPSFSTHSTFYHIPMTIRPPSILPSLSRFISLFVDIPITDIEMRVCSVRHFHIRWDLYLPHKSEFDWTVVRC